MFADIHKDNNNKFSLQNYKQISGTALDTLDEVKSGEARFSKTLRKENKHIEKILEEKNIIIQINSTANCIKYTGDQNIAPEDFIQKYSNEFDTSLDTAMRIYIGTDGK